MTAQIGDGTVAWSELSWEDLSEPRREQPRARRRGFQLAGMLLVLGLALIAAGVLTWPRAPRTAPVPDPLALRLPDDTITCPLAVFWSPDSKRAGVLGTPRTCRESEGTSTLIGIYDARTGNLDTTLDLTTAVISKIVPTSVQKSSTLMAALDIRYAHPLWSPDGKHIALAFLAVLSGQNLPPTQYGTGLEVVSTDGASQSRVLRASSSLRSDPGDTLVGDVWAQHWNLATGKATSVPLAQAMSYSWASDGLLHAAQPLPAPQSPLHPPAATVGPVGRPAGDAHFSVWQNGFVSYLLQCPPPGGTGGGVKISTTPYYVFHTTFDAWSPDGKEIELVEWQAARLAKSASPPKESTCVSDFGPSAFSPMSIRDAALRTVLGQLSLTGQDCMMVSWSPDGARLLAMPFAAETKPATITLYHSATGHAEKPFSLAPFYAPTRTSYALQAPPIWSPDGTRALIFMGAGGAVILGPKSLGA